MGAISFPDPGFDIFEILSKVQRTIFALIHLFVRMADHIHIIYKKASHTSISGNQPDLIHMIKALKKIGQTIHLHCFYPERIQIALIKEDCQKIETYAHQPPSGKISNSIQKAEIKRLMNNLMEDDAPIVFHGYQSASMLGDVNEWGARTILIRLLRDEPTYLQNLAKVTPWGPLKLRYWIESALAIKKFKILLQKAKIVSSIELENTETKINLIPEFKEELQSFFKEGNGSFCLYYGDLSKRENEYSARWLLEHVFNNLEIPFVIAGNNPAESLEQAAHVRMHTCLVSNPSEQEMSELIKKAQIVLMPSFIDQQSQDNVLKFLLWGRHILVNNKATHESPFAKWFAVAETPESFAEKIELLFSSPFTEKEKNSRLEGLIQMGTEESKALQLISLLNR